MTTVFVSRHPGARQWAADEGIAVDAVVAHLDPHSVHPGDSVIGSLPVNLAAAVCERGGRYFHLSLQLPPELRGVEMNAAQMRELEAGIEEYRVGRGAKLP